MLNTGIYSRIVGTVFPAVQKNICSSVWTIAMNLLYLPKFQQFCIVMVELLGLQEKFWIRLIWVKPKRKLSSFMLLRWGSLTCILALSPTYGRFKLQSITLKLISFAKLKIKQDHVQRWANNSVFEYYSNSWGRILVFVFVFGRNFQTE